MDDPLLFLTSTSGSAPSGRNARAAARTSKVQYNTRPTSVRGTFDVFLVKSGHEVKKTGQQSLSGQQLKQALFKKQRAGHIPRVLGPQSITIDELLTTATTRIRHDLASTLKKQPFRVRDVLRCKQWAAATFASGTLRLTPEIYSATKYLEHKVLNAHHSGQPCEIELQKYGIALSELRQCLQDPKRRMQPSALAASHILAICEMLGDTTGNNYLKFVGGIVTLSSLHARKGDYYAQLHLCSNSSPILIEALLTKRSDAMLVQPWSQTVMSAGDQGFLPSEDALTFADGAEFIFSQPSEHIKQESHTIDDDKRLLVSRARSLHSNLKQSIQKTLLSSSKSQYACPITGTVSGRLAVMLSLDDFVSQMANEEGKDASELAYSDDCSFYADAISSI